MALVSGPGRAGGSPADSELHTSKHVTYIKNLDTVRAPEQILGEWRLMIDETRGKMNWNIG